MEVRPIDAYTLNNELVSWYNDTEGETEKSILRRVMQMRSEERRVGKECRL